MLCLDNDYAESCWLRYAVVGKGQELSRFGHLESLLGSRATTTPNASVPSKAQLVRNKEKEDESPRDQSLRRGSPGRVAKEGRTETRTSKLRRPAELAAGYWPGGRPVFSRWSDCPGTESP
jgi:hypothetical protein